VAVFRHPTRMDQPPPTPEPQTDVPKPASTMSLAARLMNVFATPGDVFEEVKNSAPSTANWLVPAILFAIIGAISAIIIFSQPAIVQQIHEQQTKALDDQVKAGKMTQAQADQAMEVVDKIFGPKTLKIIVGAGAVIAGFARVFWWALVLWLMGLLFLKAKFNFLKAAEVAGLTTMISVLGVIVTILLTVNFGRLVATPSLALTISNFDIKNKTHLLSGAANVFYFWQIGVMSSGLARLSGAPFAKALLLVAGYWVLTELLLIFSGLGQLAL
jgi:Yip1-like protein